MSTQATPCFLREHILLIKKSHAYSILNQQTQENTKTNRAMTDLLYLIQATPCSRAPNLSTKKSHAYSILSNKPDTHIPEPTWIDADSSSSLSLRAQPC